MTNFLDLGSRSGAIVYHNNSILLIYRQKNGKNYYVFPGGSIELNESKEKAAIRELFEETSIVGNSIKLLFHLFIKDIPTNNKDTAGHINEYLFLCNYVTGEPYLRKNSEEYQRNSDNNYYKPVWIPIDEIQNILLYPLEVRDMLIQTIKNNTKQETVKIEISSSNLRHS